MTGFDKETFSTMRDIETIALKRNVRRIFKDHWSVFKQTNIENFINIGREFAQSTRNSDLSDIVLFISYIFKDWIKFLSAKNKSHYDGRYCEFEKYLFSSNLFFGHNFQDSILFLSILYNHQLVREVITTTFAFEHPDIVRRWQKNKARKTALHRYFSNEFRKIL